MTESSPENQAATPAFDATEFWRRYGDAFPKTERDTIRAILAGHGAVQRAQVQRFPAPVIQALLRDVAGKLVLKFLSLEPLIEPKQKAFKGFQAIASLVRHATVQKRLLHHFESHRSDLQALLLLWAYSQPTPPVVTALRGGEAPKNREAVLALIQTFGIEASLLAFSVTSSEEFDTVLQLFEAPESLAEALPAPLNAEAEQSTTEWQRRAEVAERELGTARKNVEALQKKTADASGVRAQLATLQSEVVRTQSQNQQLTQQWERKFENATQKLQSALDELKRQDDRQARRLKALEREKDEFETENRTLKKQLRHTQQLLETERKKLAQFERPSTPPPAASAPPKKAPTKPVKAGPPTPLDEIFEWVADGRHVRVTAREMKRLIDTNDEDSVFALMLALEALAASPRPTDHETRHRFLHRMRSITPFYARVLTHATTRVLVDASNVARTLTNRHGKGQLALLTLMRDELRRLDFWPVIFIADASLRHNIDEGKAYSEMIARGEIVQSDKGVEADEVLAREARRTGATVVTNDARFFHKVSPDFEPPRLTFRVVEGAVFVNEM